MKKIRRSHTFLPSESQQSNMLLNMQPGLQQIICDVIRLSLIDMKAIFPLGDHIHTGTFGRFDADGRVLDHHALRRCMIQTAHRLLINGRIRLAAGEFMTADDLIKDCLLYTSRCV